MPVRLKILVFFYGFTVTEIVNIKQLEQNHNLCPNIYLSEFLPLNDIGT